MFAEAFAELNIAFIWLDFYCDLTFTANRYQLRICRFGI